MMKASVCGNPQRFLAHALLAGGVLLFAAGCRNGRLVFFPSSARTTEPAPMVTVAMPPTPTPTPTPTPVATPLPTPPPAAATPRPTPSPTPLAPAPSGPELSTAPELPPVLFASDQYEINAQQQAALAKHAAFLKANPAIHVLLRGHTDSTASEEYNLALGQKRAESVRQALLKLGVPAGRVETVSFGEALPIKGADEPASRAANRRVEFFFYVVE